MNIEEGRWRFVESCRCIVARRLKIPPDDIDMNMIMRCAEEAIQDKCLTDADTVIIDPKTREQQEAIFKGSHSLEIIEMIFGEEPPFSDWAEKYEEWFRGFMAEQSLNSLFDKEG